MITNPLVFDPEYLPARLKGRDAEEKQLLGGFEPAVRGQQAEDVIIHGPKGVGKTLLARHAISRVDSEASIQHTYVACLGKSTAGIIRAILSDLPGSDPHRTMALNAMLSQLDERTSKPTIAVLDEADDLPDQDTLDRLSEIHGISVVSICHNKERWLSRLERSIAHRFGPTIHLSRYGTETLADILHDRVKMGLRNGVISCAQRHELADGSSGVARQAIYALEAAANIAVERGHGEIHDSDIDDAFGRARKRSRKEHLTSLPFHHHVLYEIVRSEGVIGSAELHDRYDVVADDVYQNRELCPVGRRERRNKLQKLRSYDLVEKAGENRHIEYRVTDPDIASPLDLLAEM